MIFLNFKLVLPFCCRLSDLPPPRRQPPAQIPQLWCGTHPDHLGDEFARHPVVREATARGHEVGGFLLARPAEPGEIWEGPGQREGDLVLAQVTVDPTSNVGSNVTTLINSPDPEYLQANGLVCVGWVHTHPGHPAFLSLTDVGATQVRAPPFLLSKKIKTLCFFNKTQICC